MFVIRLIHSEYALHYSLPRRQYSVQSLGLHLSLIGIGDRETLFRRIKRDEPTHLIRCCSSCSSAPPPPMSHPPDGIGIPYSATNEANETASLPADMKRLMEEESYKARSLT